MLINGDCLEELKKLESDSVDSLVTDPPAGIAFMGKAWDEDKGGRKHWIAWLESVMRECHRVLKPGAHGLVWALPRTSHWTATSLEDAGFEIRDVVTHLFGTGFPKSMDISKAIDKAAGAEREVVGQKYMPCGQKYPAASATSAQAGAFGLGGHSLEELYALRDQGILKTKGNRSVAACIARGERSILNNPHVVTAPTTDAAKQWEGWGTALKPASEHWILVRKKCSEKTVAANVLRWNTGGLNIDASRILSDTKQPDSSCSCEKSQGDSSANSAGKKIGPAGAECSIDFADLNAGGLRNDDELTIHSDGSMPLDMFGSNTGTIEKVSTSTSLSIDTFGASPSNEDGSFTTLTNVSQITELKICKQCSGRTTVPTTIAESRNGRFPANLVLSHSDHCEPDQCDFECAVKQLDEQSGITKSTGGKGGASGSFKLTNGDRSLSANVGGLGDSGGASRFFYVAKASKADKGSENTHPTVKSTALMSYLIKLVTPPGGLCIDPFSGSGSTGVAALKNGFQFLGVERDPEYFAIAQARLNAAQEK